MSDSQRFQPGDRKIEDGSFWELKMPGHGETIRFRGIHGSDWVQYSRLVLPLGEEGKLVYLFLPPKPGRVDAIRLPDGTTIGSLRQKAQRRLRMIVLDREDECVKVLDLPPSVAKTLDNFRRDHGPLAGYDVEISAYDENGFRKYQANTPPGGSEKLTEDILTDISANLGTVDDFLEVDASVQTILDLVPDSILPTEAEEAWEKGEDEGIEEPPEEEPNAAPREDGPPSTRGALLKTYEEQVERCLLHRIGAVKLWAKEVDLGREPKGPTDLNDDELTKCVKWLKEQV